MEIMVTPADLPGPDRSPDDLLIEGWVYRDIPWCKARLWQQFVDLIGEGNYKLLGTSIRRPSGDQRGQMLISPTGMARLMAEIPKQ